MDEENHFVIIFISDYFGQRKFNQSKCNFDKLKMRYL